VIIKMHALASQGRLNDVSRDMVHDYQRTSCSVALQPELSVSRSGVAGTSDRTSSSAVDPYVVSRRTTVEDATWLKEEPQTSKSSAMLPLQRLEQLESELASLNHARRRLAVDDDLAPAASVSSSAPAVYNTTVTQPKTERGDQQSVDQERNDYAVAVCGDVGSSSISPWISSSSFREVAALHRRQMCGGSVYSTSTFAAITNCLQSSQPPLTLTTHCSHPPAVDAVSSLAGGLTNSRSPVENGAESTSQSAGLDTVLDARTSATDGKEEASSAAFPRTPSKRELPTPPPYSAADNPPTSVDGISRLDSHYVLGMLSRRLPAFCSYNLIAPTIFLLR